MVRTVPPRITKRAIVVPPKHHNGSCVYGHRLSISGLNVKENLWYFSGVTVSIMRTRAEVLAASIEQQIIERAMQPGDLYGTMDGLRTDSKFARSTVSEAVRLLSDRGILEIRPGRGGGLFVAAANPVVRLRHMLLSVKDSATPVEHAIAVREALEGLVDVEAARHRTHADVLDLRTRLSALERAEADTDQWLRANWALHERIAAITPNRLLSATYVGMLRHVADAALHAEPDSPQSEDYLRRRLEIHVELVEAIIAGDEARTELAARRHNEMT
jgi:DNA-binding FadR family transcriptional regulator